MRRLGTASMRPKANSATATEEAAGVFLTWIPRAFAAGWSMLSRPTPPRMIIFSLGAPAIHSAVHLVLERTSATSASGSRATSSVTSPNFLRRSGSDLSKASQIRITIATSLFLRGSPPRSPRIQGPHQQAGTELGFEPGGLWRHHHPRVGHRHELVE